MCGLGKTRLKNRNARRGKREEMKKREIRGNCTEEGWWWREGSAMGKMSIQSKPRLCEPKYSIMQNFRRTTQSIFFFVLTPRCLSFLLIDNQITNNISIIYSILHLPSILLVSSLYFQVLAHINIATSEFTTYS